MRIPENKFWGWVIGSLVFGLVIGLAIMLWRSAALGSEITVLQHKVDAATTASSGSTGLQAQLAAAEASITALTDQNTQLQTQLTAANSKSATQKSTTKSSSTTATIAVTSRSVSPSTVATSGTITLTAKVTGSPTTVTMRVYFATSTKTFDKTYTLRRVSTSGGTQTWRLVVKAPTKVGTYHFYATATKGSVHKTMLGASPGTFKVK
jgi:hypothetical protein